MKTKITLSFLAFVFAGFAFGQSDQEIARKKGAEAIRSMDKGEFDKAIDLLNECIKLHPGTHTYLYELGFAYYLQKDYKKAISYFKKTLKTDDVTDQCYQMYGNVLDIAGDRDEAMIAYDHGLKKFPNSGRLYLEKANVYFTMEKYNEALAHYEKGIEADPAYPSNYYRAALMYCKYTEEEVWGMIYGEIFVNLSPQDDRRNEISKLLYDTYTSEITFPTDSTASVSFSQGAIEITDVRQLENFKLPFPMAAYEPGYLLAVVSEKKIDMASLNRIRTGFLNMYFAAENNKNYPNALFDYQKKVQEAGHLEAYNYWILSAGNKDAFMEWHGANAEKWNAFVEWYAKNQLSLDADNHFYRGQY